MEAIPRADRTSAPVTELRGSGTVLMVDDDELFDSFRREFLDVYKPADEAARQKQKEQWLQARGG
mgnify:CR=1 FL=1